MMNENNYIKACSFRVYLTNGDFYEAVELRRFESCGFSSIRVREEKDQWKIRLYQRHINIVDIKMYSKEHFIIKYTGL